MIRLTEAVLVRFGRFENQTLRFQEGLHVICGPNEAGKSTIQLFLRVMLYGVPNQRKTAGTLRDRERIIPWNEKTAEGILRLETDGRALEIRRRFGKTAAGDRTEILDVHTGEPVPGYTAEHLGEALMGVPAAVFEKTYWLRQEGASMAGKDEELSRRLLNLRDTGEEEISAERTLEELERAKRRSRPGPPKQSGTAGYSAQGAGGKTAGAVPSEHKYAAERGCPESDYAGAAEAQNSGNPGGGAGGGRGSADKAADHGRPA